MDSMNKFLVLCLFISLTRTAKADVLKDIGNDLASPATTKASTYLYAGAGLTLALVLLKQELSYPIQDHYANHPPLGKSLAKTGDYAGQVIPNALYTGGMLLSGALGNKDDYKNAEIMALATIYSGTIANIFKYTIHEDRPGNGNKKSFPSGHTTTAFAFASVVGAEHSLYYGIPAYALAALSGFSRMSDNKHYLHDVVGGMTLGISYGLGTHYLRRNNAVSASNSTVQFMALPTDQWDGGMVLGAARF